MPNLEKQGGGTTRLSLSDELRREHIDVMKMLEEMKAAVHHSDDKRMHVIEVMDGLLNHLRKEDELLYPVLTAAAAADRRLAKLLEISSRDMDEISRIAADLFSIPREKQSDTAFFRNLGGFIALIRQRVMKEEAILFPEYDRLVKAGEK